MNLKFLFTAILLTMTSTASIAQNVSGVAVEKPHADLSSGHLTPESLWSMGRIGSTALSPDGKEMVYNVTYYDIKGNKSYSVLYVMNLQTKAARQLSACKGYSPVFIDGGKRIANLSSQNGSSQVWAANTDGSGNRQLSHTDKDVEGFTFSPDVQRDILIESVENNSSIAPKEADLPLASGFVANDLMYKHWDQYVTTAPHPFVADFNGTAITGGKDLLKGEPYECPMLPFGGIEQLAWSPDSKSIAYTCRKKVGKAYAISTDSDIYLYDLATGNTANLCKPEGYKEPEKDATTSLEQQAVNKQNGDMNVCYDQIPQFSPCGRYVAWLSMTRDGYESDRTRLCVLDRNTGKKTYVTESFESGVNDFCWSKNGKQLYFTGVWHGKTQVYRTNLKGEVVQLTDDVCDYALAGLSPDGKSLLVKRQSLSRADEIYRILLKGNKGTAVQLTEENKTFYDRLAWGEVKERWVKTTDGKDMLCWVVYPPHFDPNKKYPTLLFCEGGPQTPVSQFWSYRWNLQIMAANDYIVIAPNRRGLPGFGMEWLEEISGDYSGLCMQDYLSAIDDIAKETYVD